MAGLDCVYNKHNVIHEGYEAINLAHTQTKPGTIWLCAHGDEKTF